MHENDRVTESTKDERVLCENSLSQLRNNSSARSSSLSFHRRKGILTKMYSSHDVSTMKVVYKSVEMAEGLQAEIEELAKTVSSTGLC